MPGGIEIVEHEEWLFNMTTLINGKWEGLYVDENGPAILSSGIVEDSQKAGHCDTKKILF